MDFVTSNVSRIEPANSQKPFVHFLKVTFLFARVSEVPLEKFARKPKLSEQPEEQKQAEKLR